MQELLGQFDLNAEQEAVFAHDWSSVDGIGRSEEAGNIDFRRLFSKRVDDFEPEHWGMLAFSDAGSRNYVLGEMKGKTIFVVHFCTADSRKTTSGADATASDNLHRVLGIAEIGPTLVSSATNVDPALRQSVIQNWGTDRWPFGLETKRAWRFLRPPLSRSTLVDHFNAAGPTLTPLMALSAREIAEIAQHPLAEVPVYGQTSEIA